MSLTNHLFKFALLMLIVACVNQTESEEKNCLLTEADSLFEVGRKYAKGGDYDAAIEKMMLSADRYISLDSLRQLANAFNNLGLYHYYLGQYDSSEQYYGRALTIDSLKDPSMMVYDYKNLGILFKKKGDYLKAIKAYREALRMAHTFDNVGQQASINYSIGNLLNSQKRFQEALTYHEEALKGWMTSGDSLRVSRSLTNIGNDFLGLEKYDSAVNAYHKSIKIKRLINNISALPIPYNNLGEAYLKKRVLDSALFYLHQAEALKVEQGNVPSLLITTNNLAELYLALGDALNTLRYLNYDTTKLINPDIKLQNLDIRWRYYEWRNQPDLALTYHMKWSVLQDSLFEEGRLATLTEIAATEIEELAYQKTISDQQLIIEQNRSTQRGIVLVAVVLLSLVVGYFLYRNYLQRRLIGKLNHELKLLNRDMFHRKRNDYTRILNMLDQVDFPAISSIRNMLFSSSSLDESLYEAASGNVNLKMYMSTLLEDLADALQLSAENISWECDIASVFIGRDQATKLSFIMCELVTNASKHAFKSSGWFVVKITNCDSKVVFTYEDNGLPFDENGALKNKGMGLNLMNGFLKSLGTTLTRVREDNLNKVSVEFYPK